MTIEVISELEAENADLRDRIRERDERIAALQQNTTVSPYRVHILDRPFHDGLFFALGVCCCVLIVVCVPMLIAVMLVLGAVM